MRGVTRTEDTEIKPHHHNNKVPPIANHKSQIENLKSAQLRTQNPELRTPLNFGPRTLN